MKPVPHLCLSLLELRRQHAREELDEEWQCQLQTWEQFKSVIQLSRHGSSFLRRAAVPGTMIKAEKGTKRNMSPTVRTN